MHRPEVVGRFEDEVVALLEHERLDRRHRVAQHRGEVKALQVQLHLARFDLREVEHAVDEAEQVVAGLLDLLEIGHERLVAGIARVLGKHLAVADDRVERRTQLVAHVGEERALGAVGALGRLLGAAQLLLGALALGDVPGDADEQAVAVVAHLADAEVERKARAVGAAAGQLTPVAGTERGRSLGGDFGDDHRDRLTDDHGGRVAEDPLGRRVERSDDTALVRREDGVGGVVQDGAGVRARDDERLGDPIEGANDLGQLVAAGERDLLGRVALDHLAGGVVERRHRAHHGEIEPDEEIRGHRDAEGDQGQDEHLLPPVVLDATVEGQSQLDRRVVPQAEARRQRVVTDLAPGGRCDLDLLGVQDLAGQRAEQLLDALRGGRQRRLERWPDGRAL